SGPDNLHAYDPELDRTFYSVFASDSVSSSFASNSASNTYASNFDLGSSSVGSDSNFGVSISQFDLDNMENNDRTLKELATPYFHGLVGKDPHKDLKEFHVVCSTMRPHGILEDYIRMNAFPCSLDGATKDWLYL
ncbi:hypothetical protein CR513_17826, partial [Mucuna pruriens]